MPKDGIKLDLVTVYSLVNSPPWLGALPPFPDPSLRAPRGCIKFKRDRRAVCTIKDFRLRGWEKWLILSFQASRRWVASRERRD